MKTLDDLRRFAVSSLFAPSTLELTFTRLGFVQADPIRAPARAQDLILRPRVIGYRAGDLDRRYPSLPVEEDTFINYGFVTRDVSVLMHPRSGAGLRPTASNKLALAMLDFIRDRRVVHPREVDARFAHGAVTNYWGGSSNATTYLLEAMHYKGLLRVARREAGIRLYALHEHAPPPRGAAERRARLDALVDVAVGKYAPVPAASLSFLIKRLRYAVPQWHHEIEAALQRARHRLARASIGGLMWYWPEGFPPHIEPAPEEVRLVAPFDPVVWDRRRFELLWGWDYRFEAYTPASRRRFGYYALPLLWRNVAIGWANLTMRSGTLDAALGYVSGRRPRDRGFSRAVDEEIHRIRLFLTSGR